MNAITWVVILGVFAGAAVVLSKTFGKKTVQGPKTGGQPADVPGEGTGPIADQ
jgi:hypothetical protein